MVPTEILMWSVPVVVLLAALVAVWLVAGIRKADTGTVQMQEIAAAIRSGAFAFLGRQYKTIGVLSVAVAAVLYFAAGMNWHLPVAFIIGAVCSAVSGYIGMSTAVTANLRVAAGARHSFNRALQIAFRGGAITGLAVTGLSLLGVWGLFMLYGGGTDAKAAVLAIVGFGFGASFVALFAQLGGGIYTKAADVGADLVGKVEAGIPEDDPRNPAVIADLVGDNVGDCAGRGADLFESTAAENIGAMVLGISLLPIFGANGILFPLIAGALGLLASIVGILVVKAKDNEDPMAPLNRGYLVTSILVAGGLFVATKSLLGEHWFNFYLASLVGLVLSYLFVYITQYYTEWRFRPVKEIAEASVTGPATNIISGLAVGMEATALPVLCICAAIYAAYSLGEATGISHGGLYGTAVATVGMLSTVGYILAMDTYGPITDNAGGIVEMSGAPEEIRNITDRLDASGNTTKALTKGYAVGSASLAAFLLFSAYVDAANVARPGVIAGVNLANPKVFIGAFIGAMLTFMFASLCLRAVGKAAQSVIAEVRRQFKARPGIMEGTEKPDYAACVDFVTTGALKQMVLPGLLAVGTPVLVGVVLGPEAVAGFLMVGTISGVIMALFLNTGGGAWDNAKKYIETGALGGKKSDPHKAAVVGDTVGDPFKDTAGPSLHVLIKLIATITLVLASLFVALH